MQDGNETWAQHLDAETRKTPPRQRRFAERLVPGLTILHHPDLRRIGERVALPELVSGREVLLSRISPLFTPLGEALRRPLADPYLSRTPVKLTPASEKGVHIHCADSTTAVEANGESIVTERLFSRTEIELGIVLLLAERHVLLLHWVNPSPPQTPHFGMVGESPAMHQVRREVQQVANLNGPVLLRGETGTGKELVAHAVHRASSRRTQPYLTVNMGAIPTSLAAAELFGAARGAFTGSEKRRLGYFQRSQGGTLFLDEIGETPPEIQVALLRTLEVGEVQPVGAEESTQVDARVIAATDADLSEMIRDGRFRAPLWHRLSGCEIHLPPLRERRDDIGRLLIFFLEQELKSVGANHLLARPTAEDTPWLPAAMVARLAAYSWPGNVRQLRNIARQLVAGCRHETEAHITPQIDRLLNEVEPPQPAPPKLPRKKFRRAEEVDEEELLDALRKNRWRFQPTAVDLGISRTALYGLVDRFPSVRKPADLTRAEIEDCWKRCGQDLETMVDELHVSRKGLRRRMTELGIP